VLIITFGVLSKGLFLSARNVSSVLSIFAEQGFLVLGVTILLISGEIDVSVGSTYGLAALVFTILSRDTPGVLAFLGGLACALVVGLINGYIRTHFQVPSLIVTLGMLFTLRGIIYFVTQGFPRTLTRDAFTCVLAAPIFGHFRISILWLLMGAAVFHILLNHTSYGNHVFAVGNNRELARMMGIKVERVLLTNFLLCSLMAGVAGMISASRLGTVVAGHGEGFELIAIAGSVIGGTLLTGGFGTVLGALAGALLLASLRSGLLLSGVPGFWYIAFVGIVLIIASIFNMEIVRRWLTR